MAIGIVDVDHGSVLVLALRVRLSAYDASYPWLAREAATELITLDRRLAAVCGG
jgi:predicted nucleic acid-binding protein